MNNPKNIADQSVWIKVKTIAYVIATIVGITFTITVAYTSITANAKDIQDMKPKVAKIPLIELKMEFIAEGMEHLTGKEFEEFEKKNIK